MQFAKNGTEQDRALVSPNITETLIPVADLNACSTPIAIDLGLALGTNAKIPVPELAV